MECLIHLTMRDFFAAASAVMVVAGLTHLLLLAFATVALGWFTVTALVLFKIRRVVYHDPALYGVLTPAPSSRRHKPGAGQ
jgi:CDP-L-myo-inositol myo-inositolphosphotransferase